tara:strand:- start:2907 stop:3857 length:951 start_codon:yes stop_codon:yes gene_type:complete
MALDVSALADFNNEVAGKIVLDTVYKGNTAEYVSIQEGIKHEEPLNLISVAPYFQGGDSVTSFSGSADFTQRNITVTKRTAQDAWNLQSLTSKYLGISALPEGSYEETLNLLNDMSADLVAKAQQDNDDFIWNAVSGSAYSGGLTPAADGLKQIITSTVTPGVVLATGTGATAIVAATAYDQLTAIIANCDANVLDAADLSFFVGTSVFQRIVSGLTAQNLFHFDPTTVTKRGGFYELPFPGYPNIKIIGGYGLRASERVILGPASDIFVGTDLISDTNNFKLWYDINTDTLRYRLRNKLGMQIGHPEYYVSNDLA